MRTVLLIIIFLSIVKQSIGQQDAQFSQYMFNGIYVNPAYAGYKEQLNLHSFYRSQWTGIPGAPRTMSFAVDAIAKEGNVGLALQLSSDKFGAQNNQSIYANYAYRIPMNWDGTSRLAFGLGIGAVQLGIDGSVLFANDPETSQFMGMQSSILPDARAGIFYADARYYVGFSADNLLSQYINIDRYGLVPQPKPHFYLTAGMLVTLSDEIDLKPSFLLADDLGGPTNLDLSAFLIMARKFWLGGSYRTGINFYNKEYFQGYQTELNAVVGAIQFFPNEIFRIGYAHDFSIGSLKGYSGGTHEISIGYIFAKRDRRLYCPKYF